MSLSIASDEREFWNRKYREAPGSWNEPDSFLLHAFSQYIRPQFPEGGTALDFAGGAGRNAIWLAQQDWNVTLIDISETGVEQARKKAGPLTSQIHFVVDDLTRFKAAQMHFDLVMTFFYLDRQIFSEIIK